MSKSKKPSKGKRITHNEEEIHLLIQQNNELRTKINEVITKLNSLAKEGGALISLLPVNTGDEDATTV